jgi:HlyD family secretion protein
VLFGNRHVIGTIDRILPVSAVFSGLQQGQLMAQDRPATQVARIRFDPDVSPPPLRSTVDVQMYYTRFAQRIGDWVSRMLGPY